MEEQNQCIKFIMNFLNDLGINNNREWFNKHKDRYLHAKLCFDKLTNFLMNEIANFDPSFIPTAPKDYVFRIYRDTRFSKNKIPYKQHFGSFMANGGKKSVLSGYYFHLEHGQTISAGGIYNPEPHILKSVRTEILYHSHKFKNLLEQKEFVQRFSGLADLKLKRPPKGFPKDHPDIELAKYKSYIYSQSYTDEQVNSNTFLIDIINSFKAMKEMNKFINDAIQLINE